MPPSQQQSIEDRLRQLRAQIAQIAVAAGRQADDVRLIAASKTQDAAAIRAAYQAGQHDFGENTVQDALSKIPLLTDAALEWHFIGHPQSNKAKYLARHFTWIHSVDSLKLAHALAQQAQRQGTELKLLLQVNISQEPQKHGLTPAQLYPTLEQLLAAALPGISFHGLMGMAPMGASAAQQQRCFASLRTLLEGCQQRFAVPTLRQLSMGMSADYPVAIREGATLVRLGSAIFGSRSTPGRNVGSTDNQGTA